MIISLPFGGAAGSTLLDSITYRAAYVACAPSTTSVTATSAKQQQQPQHQLTAAESAEPEGLVRVVDDVEDDGEWDIPLVPHIIGLRSAAVAKDADADTLSITATSGDQPDMDELAQQHSSPANPNAAAETGAPAPPARDSPTEDQIAAHWVVAEPLGEWAAKYLWASCSGAFVGHKQLFTVNDTPKDLPKRIQVVLQRALLTPTAVLVAIYYARRLPGAFNAHLNTHPGSLESAFAVDLYRGGLEMGVFKLFCIGAMLANKTLDDNTYTNKAWRDMAELSLFELNNFEMQALGIFSYRLHIQPSEWTEFASGVLAYHSATSSPPLPPIGAAVVPTPHSIVLNAFREITKAVAQPTICTYALHAPSSNSPSKKQVPNPFFYGQEEAKAVKARFYAQEEEIDNFDLDADGPLKDEYVPNRMRSKSEAAAIGVKEQENVKDVGAEMLPKPAKWSPADDPVVERQVIGCGVTKQRGSFVAPAPGAVPPPPPADKMKINNSNPGPVMARDIFAMTLQGVVPGPRTSISGPPPTSYHPFGDSPEGHQYVLPPPAYGYGPRSVPPPPCPPPQQQQQQQGPPPPPQFYQPPHPPPGYAFGPYQPCAAPTFWDAPPPHVFDHRAPPPIAFHPAPPPMNAPPPQHQMPRRATVPTIMPHYSRDMGAVPHMSYPVPQPQLHHVVQQQHLPLHHRLGPPFHHPNHPSAFAAFGPSLIRA